MQQPLAITCIIQPKIEYRNMSRLLKLSFTVALHFCCLLYIGKRLSGKFEIAVIIFKLLHSSRLSKVRSFWPLFVWNVLLTLVHFYIPEFIGNIKKEMWYGVFIAMVQSVNETSWSPLPCAGCFCYVEDQLVFCYCKDMK